MEEPSQEVIDQFTEVRDTGRVNMMDRDGVQRVASEMDLSELVVFIEEAEQKEYMELLSSF